MRVAQAGSLESCDALITVREQPEGSGVKISIEGTSKYRFGEHIRKLIEEALSSLGEKDIEVQVQDNGALDPTLRARLETAILRLRRGEGK
ncbi:MAG: citrate lyase acyl carrier protein [Synergistetes bacterium]|nr:citrate lyase acyl carrier protein [Synergistota bacterium]